MFGNLGPVEGVFAVVIFAAAWVLPLLLAIWFIRTVGAMAAAQRAIAEQLRIIAASLKDGAHTRITQGSLRQTGDQ